MDLKITCSKLQPHVPGTNEFSQKKHFKTCLPFRKLPVKNSLLGWISSSKTEVKKEDWTCNVCTLINTATRSSCAACGVAKEDPLVDQMRNKTNCNVNNGHTFCASSAGMSKNNVVGTSCNTNQGNMYATPFRKRLRSGGDNLASPSIENCSPSHASFDMNLLDSPEAVKPESKKLKSQSPSPKFPNKLIVANTPMTRNQLHATQTSTNHTPSRTMSPMNSSVNTQSSKQSLSPSGQGVQTPILPPTLCTIHKKKCIMREVRKESQNKGRMFYSCPVRNCNYFLVSWGNKLIIAWGNINELMQDCGNSSVSAKSLIGGLISA